MDFIQAYVAFESRSTPPLTLAGQLCVPASVSAFLESLPQHVRAMVELVVYKGAAHAFDRADSAEIIHDPFAHTGAGGPVRFEHHPAAALAAREAVVNFFTGVYAGMPTGG